MDDDTLPVGMRELMTRAIDEAAQRGSGVVEGEHVLLALLTEPRSPAARIAAEGGLDHDGLLDALRAERVHSLQAAGITAIDASRLQSTPRARQRPTWGASIRTLMTDAALHAGHDPDRVSFVAALRITRATIAQPGAFPP